MRLTFWVLLLLTNIQFVPSATGGEKLIFAVDVIRHGDRTPRYEIKGSSYKWPEGLGQLTALGIQQEYALGTELRSLYVTKYRLLPDSYRSGTISVRSTDVDRTLMSAQSVLMGLYPPGTGPTNVTTGRFAVPGGIQPIPIHTIPQAYDPLIPDYPSNNFPGLVESYVATNADWKRKSSELEPKLSEWVEATGIPVTDFFRFNDLADTVSIYRQHGVLPPNLMADSEAIISAGNWVFVEVYRPREIGRRTGLYLLKTIINDCKRASANKVPSSSEITLLGQHTESPLKYELFSAHDSTILSVMSAMGSPLTVPPPYASDLRFELFSGDDRDGSRVEISFNGQPVKIPGFGDGSGSLGQFEKLAE